MNGRDFGQARKSVIVCFIPYAHEYWCSLDVFFSMILCHTFECTSKVDILGFKHLNLDLSVSRVEVIRDAILELMGNELGANLTQEMTTGILRVLNYIGGALIYIRSHFADRVKILSESWEEANRERDQTKQKQREARERARQEAW